MSAELTKPADVAALFVDTCKQLRELGATRVEGFGMVACFHVSQLAPQPASSEERRSVHEERKPQLSQEEQEMQARLLQHVNAGRAA